MMSSLEKCPVCGRRGKRPCPATGGLICPACCGSHRGSKLNCPPTCAFFPFGPAGYDLWAGINSSWAGKVLQQLHRKLGEVALAKTFESFMPGSRVPTEADALAAYFPAIYHGLLVIRDSAGRTVADQWEAEGWAGLNNDEQVMMRHRRNSFVTVIESQRTLDAQTVECLDLLEPDASPLRLVDRTTAATLRRFTRLIVWLTHYPHFSRIGAAGLEISDELWPAWQTIVSREHANEQKTRPGLTLKQFLAERMPGSAALLLSLAQELRRRLLESMDVQHCTAVFKLHVPHNEIIAVLDPKPD